MTSKVIRKVIVVDSNNICDICDVDDDVSHKEGMKNCEFLLNKQHVPATNDSNSNNVHDGITYHPSSSSHEELPQNTSDICHTDDDMMCPNHKDDDDHYSGDDDGFYEDSDDASVRELVDEVRKNIIVPSKIGLYEYCDADILTGRGNRTNNQPGNQLFRSLIHKYSKVYAKVQTKYKPAVTDKILVLIRERHGRFLRLDKTDNLYYEIGDISARNKISQSLRSAKFKQCHGDSKKVLLARRIRSQKKMREKKKTKAKNNLPTTTDSNFQLEPTREEMQEPQSSHSQTTPPSILHSMKHGVPTPPSSSSLTEGQQQNATTTANNGDTINPLSSTQMHHSGQQQQQQPHLNPSQLNDDDVSQAKKLREKAASLRAMATSLDDMAKELLVQEGNHASDQQRQKYVQQQHNGTMMPPPPPYPPQQQQHFQMMNTAQANEGSPFVSNFPANFSTTATPQLAVNPTATTTQSPMITNNFANFPSYPNGTMQLPYRNNMAYNNPQFLGRMPAASTHAMQCVPRMYVNDNKPSGMAFQTASSSPHCNNQGIGATTAAHFGARMQMGGNGPGLHSRMPMHQQLHNMQQQAGLAQYFAAGTFSMKGRT